jgi:hypothetical protein
MSNKQHDDNRILKDGERYRVPLQFMDSLQREIRSHFADEAPMHIVDAFGDSGLALHKPGARYAVAGSRTIDHASAVTRETNRRQAYADSVEAATSAWKQGTSDREVERKHSVGDDRTNAWLDQLDDLTTAWSRRK